MATSGPHSPVGLFLWGNGLSLETSDEEATAVMLKVAASEMDAAGLTMWLRTRVTPAWGVAAKGLERLRCGRGRMAVEAEPAPRRSERARLIGFPMRRILFLALALVVYGAAVPATVYAQSQKDQDEHDQAQAEEDAKKKKEKEWDTTPAPLPAVKNAGPCPYVKVLYDAARYVELKDGQEKSDAVGWTGEIQSVRSACEYKSNEPIALQMKVNFAFGRGPQSKGYQKDYRYWVAVTARNQTVIDKRYFDVVGEFKPGQDRIVVSDLLQGIVIPRADIKVSGGNFEVLVGFDVTPEMADFNRFGKRFRENATAAAAGSGAAGAQ